MGGKTSIIPAAFAFPQSRPKPLLQFQNLLPPGTIFPSTGSKVLASLLLLPGGFVRRIVLSVCLVGFTLPLTAQTPAAAPATSKAAIAASSAVEGNAVIKDLPVRKVVLYKNGVGYFEHAGQVNGSQRVAIDFTSSQLNDVLQSLTVLDEGGGRIAGVNYNSTTPLAEQLKTLSLGMTEDPTSTELFGALRGQRVEVIGAPVSAGGGGTITGRLMSIEARTEKTAADSDNTVDKFYLTLVATTGAVRVIELTPSLSVRPLDASLQGQLDRYLELLASTHSTGLRHLTLDSIGQGQRQLRVSYISEVPVWKSTYRIVFPREANGKATMQGWAVVDNTVGADWDNVQLSLVAGAPQSFIQPLSQPLYARRAEIPIATELETTPQTHEAAEANGQQVSMNNQLMNSATLTGRNASELVKMMPGVTFNNGGGRLATLSGIANDQMGARIAGANVSIRNEATSDIRNTQSDAQGFWSTAGLTPGTYRVTISFPGFSPWQENGIRLNQGDSRTVANIHLRVGSTNSAVTVVSGADAEVPADTAALNNELVGGVYRPSDAIAEGDVSTSAFDDFFEYALTQPVTIHKNESAMVPILQQELPAEHVTLWSEREATPLRAVWLENKSKLTLDSGSFSIFEAGEFAGEGLLDPIHPGEKRLLSYAADQAVRVKVTARDAKQRLHHVSFQKGAIVETYMDTASVTYSATNSADMDRVVLIEHPRRNNGWTLDGGLKADEESTNLYRFKLAVPQHSTQKLEVKEHGPQYTTVDLGSNPRQEDFLLELIKDAPDVQAQIQPVIDAGNAVGLLEFKIAEAQKTEETATADEARDRDNLTALKGNDAAKRFVDELNHAEDQLQATRKQIADLEQQKSRTGQAQRGDLKHQL
jgi:hypothetical protein